MSSHLSKTEYEIMEYFWGMGYITVVLFAILQNGAFQHDFIDFFMAPFMWYVRFCKWLVYPTYDNGFNQKIAYTGGEVWVIRILAIVAVLFIMGIIMVIIMETIKQYKKMWNEISQMFLIGSLSGIAVLGDVTRKYLPVNLILLFILINMGIMLLRIYLRKKFYCSRSEALRFWLFPVQVMSALLQESFHDLPACFPVPDSAVPVPQGFCFLP